MNRGTAAGCLIMVLVVAGCNTSDESSSGVLIPLPHFGDFASYVSEDGGLELHAEIGHPVGGEKVRSEKSGVFVIHYRLGVATPTGDLWAEWSEFLDDQGAKDFILSACQQKILTPPQSDCRKGRRSTGGWLEEGLPGALGAAPLWGMRFAEPSSMTLSGRWLGQPVLVDYATKEAAADCVAVSAEVPSEVRPDGMRFSLFAAVPTLLEVCADSPFPRVVEWPDGTRLERTGIHAGDVPASPGKSSSSPWDVPIAPGASPMSGMVPVDSDWDPAGFPLTDAITHLRENEGGAKRFLAEHPEAFVRVTFVGETTRNSIATLESVTATRDVEVEASDGARFHASLTRTCHFAYCSIRTDQERALPKDGKSLVNPDEVRVLAMRELAATANATANGSPFTYLVTTVMRTEGKPDVLGGNRYYFVFLFPADSLYPEQVMLDGATGEVLWFDLEWPDVERLVGWSPSSLGRAAP